MIAIYSAQAQNKNIRGWYTQGSFAPVMRIPVTVVNRLDIPLKNQPITVTRSQLPVQNIPKRSIAVVDPNLPGNSKPTRKQLLEHSGYLLRKETHGHALTLQIDDVDKDGVWDQIFFLTNLAPHEKRLFYIYIGVYERGLYKHQTAANIAQYGRHIMPFWESKLIGWKLWYPNSMDLQGKRKPMLVFYNEYMKAESGYFVPKEEGSDIMTVKNTFGAGGMGLFEDPNKPKKVSRPAYSPRGKSILKNVKENRPGRGKSSVTGTRFSYDVVFNGPLRSRIKVTTTNWNTAMGGYYELEQYYTVVAHKSWTTCKVKFTKFMPPNSSVMFAAGMRHIMNEYKSIHQGDMIISMAKNYKAVIPDESIGKKPLVVPWEGIALVVKNKYKPKYVNIKSYGGNYLFKIPVTPNKSFEYMSLVGWSGGTVNNNEKDFIKYVKTEAKKYNNPPVVKVGNFERENK
jgi:hypothetical protein